MLYKQITLTYLWKSYKIIKACGVYSNKAHAFQDLGFLLHLKKKSANIAEKKWEVSLVLLPAESFPQVFLL